jgi:hypothetical protein
MQTNYLRQKTTIRTLSKGNSLPQSVGPHTIMRLGVIILSKFADTVNSVTVLDRFNLDDIL